MKKNGKFVVTIMLVILAVVAVVGVKLLMGKRTTPAQNSTTKEKGSPNASFKVVEYIDFQCPACAQGAIFLKKFMEENPDKVHLEMKYFPLSMHKHAFLAARYAECALRQGKFWEYHDALIEKQNQWKGLVEAKPAFESMAQDAGVDMRELNRCLEDPSVDKAIMDQKTEGTIKGVQSTPTYFINGKLQVGYVNLMNTLAPSQQEAPH